MIFSYQMPNGESRSIRLTATADGTFTATIDERVYAVSVRRGGDHALLLNIAGEEISVYAARAGNSFYLSLDGVALTLEKPSRKSNRNAHAGALDASMPGQVIEVLAEAGQGVEKGQTLVVLEAMKLEIRIKAPYDGTIQRVLCEVGQAVERGQRLIEMGE